MDKQMQRLIVTVVLALALSTCSFGLESYSGSITGGDGLFGTDGWSDATLSWTVEELGGGIWEYTYLFDVARKDISHMQIEVSDSFTLENYLTGPSVELDTWGPGLHGNSDPGIPDDMYGLKFDDLDDTMFEVTFTSDRAPIWGDFYAKDGKDQMGTIDVYAYNLGFTNPDSDPNAPPADGSLLDHILVPDTVTVPPPGPVIPAPPAVLLGTFGAGVIGTLRRRRWF